MQLSTEDILGKLDDLRVLATEVQEKIQPLRNLTIEEAQPYMKGLERVSEYLQSASGRLALPKDDLIGANRQARELVELMDSEEQGGKIPWSSS